MSKSNRRSTNTGTRGASRPAPRPASPPASGPVPPAAPDDDTIVIETATAGGVAAGGVAAAGAATAGAAPGTRASRHDPPFLDVAERHPPRGPARGRAAPIRPAELPGAPSQRAHRRRRRGRRRARRRLDLPVGHIARLRLFHDVSRRRAGRLRVSSAPCNPTWATTTSIPAPRSATRTARRHRGHTSTAAGSGRSSRGSTARTTAASRRAGCTTWNTARSSSCTHVSRARATPDDLAQLQTFLRSFDAVSPICNVPPRTVGPVIARFDQMPKPYAALVWDRVLYMDTFDPALVKQFYLQEGEKLNADGTDFLAPPEPQCAVPSPSVSPSPSTSAGPSASPSAGTSPSASASPSGSAAAPSASDVASPSASPAASPSPSASPAPARHLRVRLFAYRSASTGGRSGFVQSGRGGFGDAFPVGVDVDGVTVAQVAADGRIATEHGPVERSSLTAGPAVAKPGKIVCVGLNYGDHVTEGAGREVPTRPLLFAKFANAVIGDGEAIVRPPGTPRPRPRGGAGRRHRPPRAPRQRGGRHGPRRGLRRRQRRQRPRLAGQPAGPPRGREGRRPVAPRQGQRHVPAGRPGSS